MSAPTMKDFHRLVVEDVPLIDVRAPVEFEAGAFPTAQNLPLMNNEERHQVGICYKQRGQEAAIALGHQLVSGAVKEARIAAWCNAVEQHPEAMIYCFRGGLRSRLSQEWASAALERPVVRIDGGYKAFRTYLINQLNPEWLTSMPLVLGGRTGSGKTIVLQKLKNGIDLEAIANHRGSSFGRFISPQPTQIDFENRLAWALIQHEAARHRHMIVEDEGRHIGKRYIGKPLVEHFDAGGVVLLETSLSERVQITYDEYVLRAQQRYRDTFGEEGLLLWKKDIHESLLRIRKRLGGERLKCTEGLLLGAYEEQMRSTEPAGHKRWVELLLVEYYDPMYDYQLEKKRDKIMFRGDADEVLAYLYGLEL